MSPSCLSRRVAGALLTLGVAAGAGAQPAAPAFTMAQLKGYPFPTELTAAANCGPSATHTLRRPCSSNAHAMRLPVAAAVSSVGNG